MDYTPDQKKENIVGQQLIVRPSTHPTLSAPRAVAFAESNSDGMNPRAILDALRYWWKWALPAGILLATTAALIVYVLFTPQYQASAWLRIEEQTPFLAFESKDGEAKSKGFVQTQIELLRSPMVLTPAVLAEPKIATIRELLKEENPREWLKRRIEVKPIGTSELYIVSFACSDPQAAKEVVDAIIKSYFKLREHEYHTRVKKVLEVLETEFENRNHEIEDKRKELRKLARQVTGRDPFLTTPEAPSTEPKNLSDLTSRLVSIEMDENVLQAKIRALEELDPKQVRPVSEAQVESLVARNPQVIKALELLAQRKAQLSQLETRLANGKEHASYRRAEKIVAQERQALEDLKADLREQARVGLEIDSASKKDEQIALLRSELENRKVTRELLKDRYESERTSAKESKGDTVELKFKQEELRRAENVLDLIAERILRLETEMQAPKRVYEMKPAEVPAAPIQSLPYMNLGVAILAGLCAPFGLAILKELITRRVSDASTIESARRYPLLGEITSMPTRSAASSKIGHRQQIAMRLFEESVDAMRTNLLLGARSKELRLICITSAVNQEGKTSVSVQLAVSIARGCRERTLIIDGDMRDPSVHSVFGIPREPGLSEVLSGKRSLSEAISPTWADGVDALTAGVLDGNPHALLANNRWDELLKQIPPDYRYVIIDTPPVLAASEALQLANSADAVLVCAMRDVTRLAQLNKATERIASAGGKVVGHVLSGVPPQHYAMRYGSYAYLQT